MRKRTGILIAILLMLLMGTVHAKTPLDEWNQRRDPTTEFMQNGIELAGDYLGVPDAVLETRSIVDVALGEVGKPDSLEMPADSNDVKYNDWYFNTTGPSTRYPWCCTFVVWCADQCGFLDSGIFKKTADCGTLYHYLTGTKKFKSYKTSELTQWGGSYQVQPGDLLFFLDTRGAYEHMGIIVRSDSTYIYTVEGNTIGQGKTPGGGVASNTFKKGTDARADRGYVVHVEYPDERQIAYDFLRNEMGYNAAAAAGVLANIDRESGFVADSESELGYGLFRWSAARKGALVTWCEKNGYTYSTLIGQLNFMKYELLGTYQKNLHAKLLKLENSAQGAYDAAYLWCLEYEAPTGQHAAFAAQRASFARTEYWPKYQ